MSKGRAGWGCFKQLTFYFNFLIEINIFTKNKLIWTRLGEIFWEKIFSSGVKEEFLFGKWEINNDILCVPQHYTGFDGYAQKYLEKAVEKNEALVIVGHPAALSRNKSESSYNFNLFMNIVEGYITKNQIETFTVTEYADRYLNQGASKDQH